MATLNPVPTNLNQYYSMIRPYTGGWHDSPHLAGRAELRRPVRVRGGHHDDAEDWDPIAMNGADDDAATLRAKYRALAVEWGEAMDDPDRANRVFKAHHALYKKIRASSGLADALALLTGRAFEWAR
jgi:hypothetical protein